MSSASLMIGEGVVRRGGGTGNAFNDAAVANDGFLSTFFKVK